jgi:hypothetical protein
MTTPPCLGATETAMGPPEAFVVAEEIPEKALTLPAASDALTLYEYEVEAASPVSLKLVVVGVAICVKFEQFVPWQRSTS